MWRKGMYVCMVNGIPAIAISVVGHVWNVRYVWVSVWARGAATHCVCCCCVFAAVGPTVPLVSVPAALFFPQRHTRACSRHWLLLLLSLLFSLLFLLLFSLLLQTRRRKKFSDVFYWLVHKKSSLFYLTNLRWCWMLMFLCRWNFTFSMTSWLKNECHS